MNYKNDTKENKFTYQPIIMLVTAIITGYLYGGCIKSNQSIGTNSNYCDTSDVSYTKTILPILQTYCYSCHSQSNVAFSNGVNLEGYSNVKAWADLGFLLGDIRHDPGFIGMPYGKPTLIPCEVNKIAAWINQGEKP